MDYSLSTADSSTTDDSTSASASSSLFNSSLDSVCSVVFPETCRAECESESGLIYGATVRFSDSAALRLRRRAMVVWDKGGPQRVLIVKKPVPAASAVLLEMASWLEQRGLQVFVERSVHEGDFPQYPAFDPGVTQVDFAITLGGDGTVLYKLCLNRALAADSMPLYCTLRTRKRCEVLDDKGQQMRVYHILNETVIDRGASPSSVHLEIYVDGSFVTVAEADGLIIATPSGSTAYSMSA
eukprot:gene3609-3873_t